MKSVWDLIRQDELNELKRKSIVDFLEYEGVDVQEQHNRHVCLSPFTNEGQASLVIYPENNFYDYSSGFGGTIIDLVMGLYDVRFSQACDILSGDKYKDLKIDMNHSRIPREKRKFNLETYFENKIDQIRRINKYIDYRGLIRRDVTPSKYYTKNDLGWRKVPCVGFIHRDERLNPCGIKLRSISDSEDQRWNSRGRLYMYVLEHHISPRGGYDIYISESETSSNSLYRFLREIGKTNFVVLSIGGVNAIPKNLPIKYQWENNRYLVIDYDGDDDLYRKRVDKFKDLNAQDIKIELSKGFDINSLYTSGDIFSNKYIELFLNN